MADSSKKSYYEDVIKDAGLDPVTSEELQSKFDAITKAEYDKQRTNLQTATNKYYNQLYDTQQTTMDTIRQANAQAVASGASKGVQAANELSALLGLQSEAVTGATDLANQATTLAQDESQAMLENMLTAETQAAEQNQALAQILTQAGSVDVEQQNANTAKQQVLQQYWDKYLQAMADGNTDAANKILVEMRAYSTASSSNENSNQDTEDSKQDEQIKAEQAAARKHYKQYAQTITNSINFDWDDSFYMWGTPFLNQEQKYVSNNVSALTDYYVQMGIPASYAKEDLSAVRDAMHHWFEDTGTHKASTQSVKFQQLLENQIKARIDSLN